MGKGKDKGKGGKKSKKGKEDVIDWSLYPEGTTEIPNPNFHFGYDAFNMPNGDIYVGHFCAHKIGIAWREGNGIYITKDSHIYEGLWENDQLLCSEETKITYPDGIVYLGQVVGNKYNGCGTYILENGLPIDCNFRDNHPFGLAILTDPQNRLWKGTNDDDHIILRPENHFYNNLSHDRGVGKKVSIKQSEEEILNAKSIASDATCMRDLQELIFKKSTKTLNSVSSAHETAVAESSKSDSKKSLKQKSSSIKARTSSNISLLRTFLSKEYRNMCSPYHLLYPTVDMERKEE